MTSITMKSSGIRQGSLLAEDGVTFRAWAPERSTIALVFVDSNGRELNRHALAPEANGYFAATIDDLEAGRLYAYQLDDDSQLYPDPASHFQPLGVFGPSQVVDHQQFGWTDHDW